MDLTIEVPQGGIRTGITKNGQEWQSVHPHAYGGSRSCPTPPTACGPTS